MSEDLIKRSDAIYVLCNGCNKVSQCVHDKYSWCDKGLTMRVGIPSAGTMCGNCGAYPYDDASTT